jgi:hypothetical protein
MVANPIQDWNAIMDYIMPTIQKAGDTEPNVYEIEAMLQVRCG